MPLPLFKLTHEVIHRLDYLFYHLFASILSICLYTTKNIQTNGTNHTINKMIKTKKKYQTGRCACAQYPLNSSETDKNKKT